MSGSDSTPEKIIAPSRKRAGSVRKRNKIPSDDEEEKEVYDSTPEEIVTPSPSKKRSMSVGSVGKRHKILSDDEGDETSGDSDCNSTAEMVHLPSRKQSMSGGSMRKRPKFLSDDEDETSDDLNCNSTPEIAPLQSRKSVSGESVRKRHKILSDDEDETSNISNCTPGSTLETRASASRVKGRILCGEQTEKQQKKQPDVQSIVSLENENCTDDSYMYDSQDADSESSSDSLSNFIVEDSEISQEMDSQDQAEVVRELQLLRKLPRHEAHGLYVQMVLSNILENDPLKKESDPSFKKAKEDIENDLWSRKNLIDSSAWGFDFKEMIAKCSVVKVTTLSSSMQAECQACRRDRCITKSVSFYYESDDEIVKEFKIGRHCAAKALLSHRIHHYCSVELRKGCIIKVGELREEMALSELSVKDIVQRYCEKDEVKAWLKELFADFQKLLNRAEEWADDGKKYREMMNTVSSYM